MAVSGLDLLRVGVVKVFTEIGCYDLDSDRGGGRIVLVVF